MTPIVPIRLSSRLLRISDRFMTFLVPFASPEDDFSGDVDNFRRVVPRVVDKEARSLLFKYMGDLYRVATDIFGEPLQIFNGAGSELGGVVFGSVYRALY